MTKFKRLAASIIVMFSFILSLCGCASQSIQIKDTSTEESNKNDQIIAENDKIPDPERDTEMGEKFLAKNLIVDGGSGEIYMSVDNAKVYDSLSEAGIKSEDCFEIVDGLNYDAQTDSFLGERKLVLLEFTIENIDATSRSNADSPERFGKYDFRVDDFGGCANGPLVYSDKHGEVSSHYMGFHLEPGSTTQIVCGYLVDLHGTSLDKITFNTAATPENGAIINLHLGDN